VCQSAFGRACIIVRPSRPLGIRPDRFSKPVRSIITLGIIIPTVVPKGSAFSGSIVGRVRFFGAAKKRNPTIVVGRVSFFCAAKKRNPTESL